MPASGLHGQHRLHTVHKHLLRVTETPALEETGGMEPRKQLSQEVALRQWVVEITSALGWSSWSNTVMGLQLSNHWSLEVTTDGEDTLLHATQTVSVARLHVITTQPGVTSKKSLQTDISHDYAIIKIEIIFPAIRSQHSSVKERNYIYSFDS